MVRPRYPVTSTRFYLDSDGDGHWYIVPLDRASDWETFLESVSDGDCLPLPDWVRPVGGSPTRVTFSDPQIT
jgi:hypothetical protein